MDTHTFPLLELLSEPKITLFELSLLRPCVLDIANIINIFLQTAINIFVWLFPKLAVNSESLTSLALWLFKTYTTFPSYRRFCERNDVHILNVLCLRALKSTKLHLFYKRTEWPEWQMIKTDKKEYSFWCPITIKYSFGPTISKKLLQCTYLILKLFWFIMTHVMLLARECPSWIQSIKRNSPQYPMRSLDNPPLTNRNFVTPTSCLESLSINYQSR